MVRKPSRAAGALEGPFDARRVRATWRTTPRAPRRTTAWPRVATDGARGASASYTTGELHRRSTPVYTGEFIFISVWAIRTDDRVFLYSYRTEGWCSWCGERCAHLVRDKTRTRCQCLVCGGGTAPCDLCPGVMRTRERPRMPTAGAGRGQLGTSNSGSPRARACAARLSGRARVPMRLPRCGRWYRRVAPRPMPPPRTSAMSSSGVAGGPNARRRGERGGPSRC